jgi:DNA (cytosine-5)-methyltransferase 1
MEHKTNVIDLFAGCGGFSVGFERAGYNITKAVEFDKDIAASYSHNHKGTLMIAEDIGKIADMDHFSFGEADVIIGGPPCQGFSMAGERIREKKAFINDPRNYLFRHYVEVVKIVRPKVFLLENVKGILSKDKGAIFKEIVDAFGDPENFNGDKYYLHYKVCKAVEFGIPQRRERVVVIGVLNKEFDIDKLFDETKEIIELLEPNFFKPVSLREAISDIPLPSEDGICTLGACQSEYQASLRNQSNMIKNHIASRHNDLAIGRMQNVGAGQNWQVLNEEIHSVHSGAYGRLEWDQPTMTITTRFDTPAGGRFIHPVEDRTLTPREAARVQSFPDSFEFIGNKTIVCKQIGNAVPPKLSYFLANAVNILLCELSKKN